MDTRPLELFRDEMRPEFEVVVDDRAIFLRSAEPPSWIQLFADAQWWVKALGAYAALYVSELVKESAKETWRHRAKMARASVAAGNRILRIARSLKKLQGELPDRTDLVLGLPVPDDHFGVRFVVFGRDEDLLAAEIALFVRHLPAIERLVEDEGLRLGKVVGAVNLQLREDGTLHVGWMDRERLNLEERILVLPNGT